MSTRLHNLCFRCGRSCTPLSAGRDSAGRQLCPACTAPGGAVVGVDGTFEVIDDPSPPRTRAPCPFCGAALPPGAVKCPACGKLPSVYAVASERDPSIATPEPAPCSSCGYDLKGLPTLKCPECGTMNRRLSRSQVLDQTSREVLLAEIRRPAWMAGISVGLLTLLLLLTQPAATVAAHLFLYAVSVAVAAGTFVLCGVMGLGLDPPFWLVLLRMSGIIGTVQLISGVCSATRLPGAGTLGFGAGVIVFAFLLTELFELDPSDSWTIIVVNSGAWVVLTVLVAVLV